jgi:hypothetical protein
MVEQGKYATDSGGSLKRISQLGQAICLVLAGSDALCREPIIGGQFLEQLDDPPEKYYCLGAMGTAMTKAGRLQGAVASPVGRPLMLEDRKLRRHKTIVCHTSQKRSFRP